jgi:exopolysaccharide production protein ExoQ
MRVARTERSSSRPLLSIAAGDLTDWALCFVSITGMLSGSWVGSTVSNLVLILPWVWIAARNLGATIGSLCSYWPILALPLFAILSAAWSDYPAASLRGGAQFLVTAIIGVLAGSCVKRTTMLLALFSALGFVNALDQLVGVFFGSAHLDPTTAGGFFGSKNYVGLSFALLLLTATALAFDKSQPGVIRTVALTAAALSAVFMVRAGSAGASVCSVAAITITCILVFIVRFAPHIRFAALLLIAPLVGVFLIVWLSLGDTAQVLNSFGKDVTLTGRTWLWEWAKMAIAERPIAGFGYEAFWQPGNWGAEEIWSHDQHPDKTGYHFHNTFLQVAVDLGYVGLFVLLATVSVICIRIVSVFLLYRLEAQQIFAIAMFLFLLFRLPIEVDLFWQFSPPTIVLSMIWVYLALPQRQRATTAYPFTHSNADVVSTGFLARNR